MHRLYPLAALLALGLSVANSSMATAQSPGSPQPSMRQLMPAPQPTLPPAFRFSQSPVSPLPSNPGVQGYIAPNNLPNFDSVRGGVAAPNGAQAHGEVRVPADGGIGASASFQRPNGSGASGSFDVHPGGGVSAFGSVTQPNGVGVGAGVTVQPGSGVGASGQLTIPFRRP
jgi:hypothetical protein